MLLCLLKPNFYNEISVNDNYHELLIDNVSVSVYCERPAAGNIIASLNTIP